MTTTTTTTTTITRWVLYSKRCLSYIRTKQPTNLPPLSPKYQHSHEYMYDFRSDTVTQPCAGMRKVMAEALVGDDVFKEDPTVTQLQDTLAHMTGKQSALFVVSGTLSNQLGIMTHLASPPHSILLDASSHIHNYECAGVAFHSGAGTIPLTPRPPFHHLTADVIEKSLILDDDIHYAPTRIISLENTLNGQIFPLDEIRRIHELAKEYNMKMHLDGARLWNASAATGISIADYCQYFDTASSDATIKKARHLRKLFGGGWRQAGILASAGLFALQHNLPTLPHIHTLARTLSEQLMELGITITKPVETNMVWVDFRGSGFDCGVLEHVMKSKGILMSCESGRLVLHHQINQQAIDLLIESIKEYKQLNMK